MSAPSVSVQGHASRNPMQIHRRIEVCRHERILGYVPIYSGGGGGEMSILR